MLWGNTMPKIWALGAAIAVSMGCSLVATAVEPPAEYGKMIQEHSRIGALDGGFFGDKIGLSTGSLEFTQTDVSLPGNDGLSVRVGRRFEPGSYPATGHFSDWDLDIPHLHGVFGGATSGSVAWEVNALDSDHRCSEFNSPPEITDLSGGSFSPDEYWHGTFLYLPGDGDQELLSGGDVPASGGPYPASTRQGAVARCLTSLASTSESGSSGEGFEVVTPDGTVYTFDQMVSRNVDDLHKSDPTPMLAPGSSRRGAGSARLPGAAQGLVNSPSSAPCCNLQRREFFLYPTKITDRFGNTVTYTWSTANPWRLLSIVGSDNRTLTLTYSSSDANSILVQSVSAGPRTWTYAYTGTVPDVRLASVTQPDLHAWQFDLLSLHRYAKPTPNGVTCDAISLPGSSNWTGSITAPSGATAQYTMTSILFGRSWAQRDCKVSSEGAESIVEPYLFVSAAITSKTISGPGLPSGLAWSYAYGAPNHCWDPYNVPANDPDAVLCTSNSPTSRTTTVTEPNGAVSRYSFGNRVKGDATNPPSEGLLLTEEHADGVGNVLRTTTMQYGKGDAAPYGSHQGNSLRRRGDWIITGQRRPQSSAVTAQQGKTFSWSVATTCSGIPYCFDTRARPTNVVRTGVNTPAASQAEAITYDDDTTHWILGQVAARTIDGIVASSTTFDASHRPWKIYAFGKLGQTVTYNTNGTLATVADGNSNVTTYGSWKRGIPQSVLFADSTSRTASVDDNGWILSVTDENGYATTYEYDDMGRVKTVTYPASDSQTWQSTTSTFAPVMSAENGLAAGHWRETVSTGLGNTRKVTLFDALWRPVLVREYDNANPTGTDRYVATAYDKAGHVSDASYPLDSTGSALTLTSAATWQFGAGRPKGVRTSYDALGRPVLVQQDSELGVLNTTTAYLTNFQRQVTDARNNVTTEQFMAWDSPTFDWPVQVDAPEAQRTTIVRDTFGKPVSITRGATP
jgi:YD repeat-containing protein